MEFTGLEFLLEPNYCRLYQTYGYKDKKAEHEAGYQSYPSIKVHEVAGIIPHIAAHGILKDITGYLIPYN